MPRLKAALPVLFLATAFAPAIVTAQSSNGAVPGSLNYVQGQVNIDGQPLDTSNYNSAAPRTLRAGETFATANGSADLLLAPGALLRLGQNTTVHMVAADDGRTEVQLQQGRANASVNVVRHDHLLLVDMQGGQTQMVSRGLYTFNTADNTMRVFNGEAEVFPGSETSTDVKPVKVKEGRELALNGERTKPEKFDREMEDADLLPWTGPQESQAALRNSGVMYGDGSAVSSAAYYPGAYSYAGGYGYPGYGLYGPAAYGDPFYWDSPLGWGPYGFWGYPFFGVGFGFWSSGFYGGHIPHSFPPSFRGGFRGGYTGRGLVGRGRGYPGGIGGVRSGFAGGRAGFNNGAGFHGGGGFRGGSIGGIRAGGGHR